MAGNARSRRMLTGVGFVLLILAGGVAVALRADRQSVPAGNPGVSPRTIGPGAPTPAQAAQAYIESLTLGRFAEAVALTRHRDGTPITGTEAVADQWLYESYFGNGNQVHMLSMEVGVGGALEKVRPSDPPGVTMGFKMSGTSQTPCFTFNERNSIASAALEVNGGWYVTAISPFFALFTAAPCQVFWQRYAQNPAVVKLAKDLPFTLVLPGYLPGNPSIDKAEASFTPSTSGTAGTCSPALGEVRFSVNGEAVLTLKESNGLLPPPDALGRWIEVIGIGGPSPESRPRPPIGFAYAAGQRGRPTTNAFWVQLWEGTQLLLLSTRLSGEELAAAVALRQDVSLSPTQIKFCPPPGYILPNLGD